MALHSTPNSTDDDFAGVPLVWSVGEYHWERLVETKIDLSRIDGSRVEFGQHAEAVLVMDPGKPHRAYQPLEHEPELFEEFANKMEDTADGVLNFANRYGHLGISRRFIRSAAKVGTGQRQEIETGEALADWVREIRDLREVFEVWECLSGDSAEEDLERYIKWSSKGVVSLQRLDGFELIAGPSLRPELLRRWKQGEVVGPANAYIASKVNAHLRQHVSPQLLMGRSGALKPYVRTFSLLGAIWYQAFTAFTRAKVKRCAVCDGFMTFERSTKTMHERCATRERQKRLRKRLGEAHGKTKATRQR